MVEKRARVRKEEVATREYTVNLHKRLHGCTLSRRLQRQSRKSDVCPKRIRVRIARKRNDDEDAKEEFYSLVTVADLSPEECKGLGTKVIDEEG